MVNQNKEYYLGLYEKSMPNTLSWEEKLKVVKEAGFDYLEMSIDETEEKLARLDQSVDEIEKAIEKTGVPIKSICLSGHRKYPLGSHDPKIRERGMEIMEKAICLAARLGVRVIQLAGYDVYYEEGDFQTRDYFKMNLKEAAIMAAKQGVLLGFETMETPFMDTVEKAMLIEKENELLELMNQAEEYINSIEKSELRMMFRFYYIDGMTWLQVAHKMNQLHPKRRVAYTEDSCRMRNTRFFQEN